MKQDIPPAIVKRFSHGLLLLLGVIAVLASVKVSHDRETGSEAFCLASEAMRNEPPIAQRVGKIQDITLLRTQRSGGCGGGECIWYRVRIGGDRGTITGRVHVTGSNELWKVESINIEQSKFAIDLLMDVTGLFAPGPATDTNEEALPRNPDW